MTDAQGPVAIFAAVYLQALAIALLCAGTGRCLHRKLVEKQGPVPAEGAALRWSRGFFLGVSTLLVAFVILSRLVGARAALWIVLGGMGVACALEVAAWRRNAPAARPAWWAGGSLLALIAGYSIVNIALWLLGGLGPGEEPTLLSHLGSIHSGRHANYAIFIAAHDRVPWLAQNAAQSILASIHLMLGTWSPLAALMAWIPVSMAFLTLLVFGLFRTGGFGPGRCAAMTFMVMFCNVAVSVVHVLVFDNGSPLAFIAYTDTILSIGTFLVFAGWLREELVPGERGRGALVVPALFGVTWCWHAPQNLLIGLCTGAAVALVWNRKSHAPGVTRRLAIAGAAFVLGMGFGSSQLGTLLPAPLREDTGLWTQEVGSEVRFRPYIHYLRGHWTHPQWNVEGGVNHLDTRLYERTYDRHVSAGADELYRRFAWLVETHAWESLRIFGFPLLGLVLLGIVLRSSAPNPGMHAWLALSAASWVSGYLICFLFELAHMKWWLTRFLVPGSAMGLTCLGFAALLASRDPSRAWSPARRSLMALLVVGATIGPMLELQSAAMGNFFLVKYPILERLAWIARYRSYFILDTVESDASIARRDPRRHFTVGEAGRGGVAIFTRPMPLAAGAHRAAFRIFAASSVPSDTPVAELDVVTAAGKSKLARRVIRPRDLMQGEGGSWAVLDFDLPRPVQDASIRLSNAANAVFVVTDVRLEPR